MSGALRDIYYDTCNIITDYIPIFKIGRNATEFGNIQTYDDVDYTIRLSDCLFDIPDSHIYYMYIVKTVCHEIAHLQYWNHNKEHEDLTYKLFNQCYSKLDYNKYKNKIDKKVRNYPYYTSKQDLDYIINVDFMDWTSKIMKEMK